MRSAILRRTSESINPRTPRYDVVFKLLIFEQQISRDFCPGSTCVRSQRERMASNQVAVAVLEHYLLFFSLKETLLRISLSERLVPFV